LDTTRARPVEGDAHRRRHLGARGDHLCDRPRHRPLPGRETPLGVIAAPTALFLLYQVIQGTRRRFHRWGYAKTEDELHVAHGVFVHTETSVAFHRVQHIDISQGPIERLCGVCQLVLNTAGTLNSKISLPGLSRATAEALRDEIRQHIRADKE
jgi:membrane protein YdbS with pleckstrin-like domain